MAQPNLKSILPQPPLYYAPPFKTLALFRILFSLQPSENLSSPIPFSSSSLDFGFLKTDCCLLLQTVDSISWNGSSLGLFILHLSPPSPRQQTQSTQNSITHSPPPLSPRLDPPIRHSSPNSVKQEKRRTNAFDLGEWLNYRP
ncbi:hypothetical protein MRB53_030719 [Persea americana]|uniref:Uncharacterized protein n=1 Tax=Persea americana TaxID=3435 RepID=A0ACC2KM12_PERAE|nr:hypothetical protein MRB53_030719 [Persea americana]